MEAESSTLLNGGLFTRDFLIEGIGNEVAWQRLDDATLDCLRNRLDALFASFGKLRTPTEADTEKELIWPLLEALGWSDMLVQQNLSARRRDDVPDALLFPNAEAKQKAMPLTAWQRFQHGVCVVEAKRWSRSLDRADAGQTGEDGVPSTQMLRYLRRVDDVTNGGLRWGILTNGRHWRLYFRGALSIAEDFLEIDLGKVLDLPGCERDLLDKRPNIFPDDNAWRCHFFRLFAVIFGCGAFLPDHRGESFHQLALRQGKQWEARVARDLSNTVFGEVFPQLCRALAAADGQVGSVLDAAYLDELREGALILLYRVLFVLYAEDRNLLPDEIGPYADYSLTRLRLEVAAKEARGDRLSDRMKTYWSRLDGIFQAIGQGDNGLGIPPYNGGLFDPSAAPILARIQLPDCVVADVVFRMSHLDLKDGRPPKYINYRDLSVQQLGSVYERILEHGLNVQDGQIEVAENPAARKGSGSYYTPEELVALIIERAVGPLVSELTARFTAKADQLAGETRAKAARLADLQPLDPASRILELKVCDPAMGSGHFLVSLVDWLSDRVLDAMAEATAAVIFAPYVSPLAARIETIRSKILAEAKAHDWPIAEAQLDDRHIVRRMVLKRVVYGIDKNPMAVELAKVALWLHSFTVGAPLSFLDHHLRCGDSILGTWARPTVDALKARGALFHTGVIAGVDRVAGLMAEIEETTDNDISEVAESKTKFGEIEEETRPVAAFFSLLIAEKLMGIFDAAPKKAPLVAGKMEGKSEAQLKRWRAEVAAFEASSAFQLALEGTFGDPVRIAEGETKIAPPDLALQIALLPEDQNEAEPQLFPDIAVDDRRRVLADRLVNEARARAASHRFFHWEIGFPNVWSNLLSASPRGGFDAVIGNPPYVRQELLGDEIKRALKAGYSAYDGMADLYVFFFEQGLRLLRPGGRLSYVVTNKWLRAGYAEALRELLTTAAQVEFIADFGHAKHFFPDADVFPSVITVRKLLAGEDPSGEAQVCVIPRDAVPEKGLATAVDAATYPRPRACFTKESWSLEPPDVMALLSKIRRNGVPLTEYAGVRPMYGIKTGFNEAFLIDAPTRDRLAADDPACAELIKPYQRGQDIKRWWSAPSGLYMIVLKSSSDHHWPWADLPDEIQAEQRFRAAYPALHRHMKKFEGVFDSKTGKPRGLRHREDQGRFWWELRPCAYYGEFSDPKIYYQVIQYHPQFSFDITGSLSNDKTFFLANADPWLIASLNSPLLWWFDWRYLVHLKDEALNTLGVLMESVPIADAPDPVASSRHVEALQSIQADLHGARCLLIDWYRHSLGIEGIPTILRDPFRLSGDLFISAISKTRDIKKAPLTSAAIGHIRDEYSRTVEPMARRLVEALQHERAISDLVNAAYGLTPEEVALMWRTAPPRMPLDPKEELRRLGLTN